jgi:hypothetical protein
MKMRPARSFERAITQIISALGEETAANTVGRSASLVRKWSDPDNSAMPSIEQALALDRAFVKMKLEPAPIHAVYLHRLENAYNGMGAETETMVMALFNLHASIGLMTRTLAELMEETDPHEINLSSKIELTPFNKESLLAEIEKVSEELSDFEKSVRSH